MCGILGVVGEVSRVSSPAFRYALDTIAHRGPDAVGIWRDAFCCLGHRRLAIIDLSEAGNQPMVDPDSGLVIVFNGEIYNYLELRTELAKKGHRFRTGTDTEVLLKGYQEWGEALLHRCNGMWAFVIWDPRNECAFLSRDRFGVKPLYYVLQPQRLLFASEPKALHALDASLLEPDAAAIVDLIVESRLHVGGRSFYRSIHALPPAHNAVYEVSVRRYSLRRYWDYPQPEAEDETGKDKESDEQFAELFLDAVRLRLRSDVPIGLTLSGGLDSTAVLAAARECGAGALTCYTSVYSNSLRGEEIWAETAANLSGTTIEPVEAKLDGWWSSLGSIVWHMDSPVYSPAVLPLWSIMARAKEKGIPVLLEGQGADELLAGYPQYWAVVTLGHFKAANLNQFLTGAYRMSQTFTLGWAAGFLAREAFPKFGRRITRDRRLKLFNDRVIEAWRNRGNDFTVSIAGLTYDDLRAALWKDHSCAVLPALLHYGDAISMAHGVESRLPFMDYRLVEWIFRKHPSLIGNNESKSLVRTFLRQRKYDVIANRNDKQGFPTPMGEWYRMIGRKILHEILSDHTAPIWSFMKPNAVSSLAMAAERGSKRALFHLYKVFVTERWLRDLKNRSALALGARGVQRSAL